MKIRRLRRKVRCLIRYGPHGCPHIERHSRRPKKRAEAYTRRTARHVRGA